MARLPHHRATGRLARVGVLDHGSTCQPCSQQQHSHLRRKDSQRAPNAARAGQDVQPSPKTSRRWERGPWKSLTEMGTPPAAPSVKILPVRIPAIPSCVFFSFFHLRIHSATQQPFAFGWGSFFQHRPSCPEVGAARSLL